MNFLILEFISSLFYIYFISMIYVQYENLFLLAFSNFIIIFILTTIGKSDNIFFNLTITFSFIIFKKETLNKSILRLLCQILGSSFGFCLFLILSSDVKDLSLIPIHSKNIFVGCIYEMICLICLTTWVLSTSFNNENDLIFRSLIYSLFNSLVILCFRNITGNSFNFYFNFFGLILNVSNIYHFISYLTAHFFGILIGGFLNKNISIVKKYNVDYKKFINN